jgi:hypothetical protein
LSAGLSKIERMSDNELAGRGSHDLLLGGLDDIVAENAHAARRLARLLALYWRYEQDHQARRARDPHFTLTPLQETCVEVSELWGMSSGQVARQVRVVRTLLAHFRGVWELCLLGQLDTYKASIISELAAATLSTPEHLAQLAARLEPWLLTHIPEDPARRGLVNVTVEQLRRKLSYELAKIRPKNAEERFRRSFADRRVAAHPLGDGIGVLSVTTSVDEMQRADYRLTLLAKALRNHGDQRTLEQLRSDLALDLIVGRVSIDAALGELQDADDSGDEEAQARVAAAIRQITPSRFARPVINVTVPIQTLMGLSDDPGTLSGGHVIPASLARAIARSPGSTWHRMLTDPVEGVVERSTKSYHPTRPIWLDVVARDSTCFRSNCPVASTTSELDHKQPYPHGPTSTSNLHPACRTDHKAKHAEGFALGVAEDGTPMFHTRAGFSHPIIPTEVPEGDDSAWGRVDALLTDVFKNGFTAAEFLDTLEHLRSLDDGNPEAAWFMYHERKLRAGYHASYPDAGDDEIMYWIYGDAVEGEERHERPPILVDAPSEWESSGLRQMHRDTALVG